MAIARTAALTKSPHIQNGLLLILPKLAAFRRDTFSQKYLGEATAYIDRLLLQDRNRHAFIAMGLLAVAVRSDIQPHLRTVMSQIRAALPAPPSSASEAVSSRDISRRQRQQQQDQHPAIFACVSMLARAVRHAIRRELAETLESMLSVGLSPALTVALHELAVHIPAFRKEIADGLLRILSLILMQQPFLHPGTPRRLISPAATAAPVVTSGQQQHQTPQLQQDLPDTPAVVLALRTLGSFDFEGQSLLQFVRHCADNYLHSEEKPIRLEAVKTCSSLLKNSLLSPQGKKSPTVMSTVIKS